MPVSKKSAAGVRSSRSTSSPSNGVKRPSRRKAYKPNEPKLSDRSNMIVSSPGICGGEHRIFGTRIPVWVLVAFRQQGMSDRSLLRNYPTINKQQLMAAWEFAEQNKAIVAEELRLNEA
jgi:uncharacterized protein (DUF433 family)